MFKIPFAVFAPEGDGAAAPDPAAPLEASSGADAATGAADAPTDAGGDEAAPSQPEGAPGGSLLSDADGKEAKPAEGDAPVTEGEKAPEGEKKAEGDAPTVEGEKEAAPEPIAFEPFTLPEGVTLADEVVKEFTGILGDRELSPQEMGQKLVELYVKEQQGMADAYAKMQAQVWNERIDAWKDEVRNDPTLGGNRLGTNLSIAKAAIEEFLPDQADRAALFEQLNVNGMGNFKPFVKLMHSIGTAMNVLEDRIIAAPSAGAPQSKSRAERWYGANGKSA